MRTNRTISNISYNSPAFLEATLARLSKDGVIDWAYWIFHEPDTDDKKPHAHIVLKPSKQVDTGDLRAEFMELDVNNPAKPFSVTAKWFFTNSLDDWLLYAVHDRAYLRHKGLTRNCFYRFEDLHATDLDALRVDWNAIDRRLFDRLAMLQDAVENGIPFAVLVQQGKIPMAQRQQYQWQYQDLYLLNNGFPDSATSHALAQTSVRRRLDDKTQALQDKILETEFEYDGDADDET